MKVMKPIYGSALFMALWLSGCGNKSTPLPANAPLIGEVSLRSQENRPNYAVSVPVCNRGPEKLTAKVYVTGDKNEILGTSGTSGFGAGSGAYLWFTLFEIKEKRTKPVYLRIEWQRGQEQGVKRFAIAPKQTDEVKIK